MNKCQSCLVEITPQRQSPSEAYCNRCADAEGNLRSAPEILAMLTEMMREFEPDLPDDLARRRARQYMGTMPAWAAPLREQQDRRFSRPLFELETV